MPLATTYNQVGNREDILDWLTRVEPETTPKLSSFPKSRKPNAMLVEYQTDDLDAPVFAGVLETEDVDSFKDQGDGRVMLSSRMQKFRESWQVSTEQELVDTAGVKKDSAYAKAKALVQHKISLESAIGSATEAAVQSGSTPYTMRGLVKWIDASNTNIPEAVRTPSDSEGTTSSLTEAGLNTVLQSVYEQAGTKKNFKLFAGPTLKNKISLFTRTEGTATQALVTNQSADSQKLTLSVMNYHGDFGTVAVINDLFIERTSGTKAIAAANREAGLLIDPSLVSVAYMKAPTHRNLEDGGGGPRGYWECIATIMVKNPLGLGRFT